MCLAIVTNKKRYPEKTGVGYQVFSMVNGKLYPEICDVFYRTNQKRDFVPLSHWEIDHSTLLIHYGRTKKNKDKYYHSGFHIFLSLDDAKIYANDDSVIHKVLFKDVLAQGYQMNDPRGLKTVITRKRCVLKKVIW